MFKRLKNLSKPTIATLLILVLSFSLRAYRIESRFTFGADEEYQSTLAETIVDDPHPIWIGVNAGGTGAYIGPGWTYFTALLEMVSKDPVLMGYVAAVIGTITTYAVISLGRMFGTKVGLTAGFLYSILPLIVFFDQRYWNPTLIPLIITLILLFLIKLRNNSRYIHLIAALFAVSFHVHFSLIPLGLVILYGLFINRKVVKVKDLGLGAVVFLIIISPLIVFDVAKKGENIKSLISSGGGIETESITDRSLKYMTSLSRLFYLEPGRSNAAETRGTECIAGNTKTGMYGGISLLALMALASWLIKKDSARHEKNLLSLSVVVVSLGFFLFQGPVAEYYLLSLFPLLIIVISSALWRLWPVLTVAVLGVLLVVSTNTILNVDESYGLGAKKILIEKVRNEVGDKDFRVETTGDCYVYEGWRYLFHAYGITPASSSTDNIFGWLYKDEIVSGEEFVVTIGATKYSGLDKGDEGTVSSGGFTARIEEK